MTPASSFPKQPPSPWRGRREARGPVGEEAEGENRGGVTSGGKERERARREGGVRP